MKLVSSLHNGRTNERMLLAKYPNIRTMFYKRLDKMYLKAKVTNDTKNIIQVRIEFWNGNRLIDSVGRDSTDHVSQKENIIQPNKSKVLGKVWIIPERDDNSVILVATNTDYRTANHLAINTKLEL